MCDIDNKLIPGLAARVEDSLLYINAYSRITGVSDAVTPSHRIFEPVNTEAAGSQDSCYKIERKR